MFVDRVTIEVEAGRGGDGCMSFRREKFVPRGGPNGGDGGRGGDVSIVARSPSRTLRDVARRPRYEAKRGESGSGYLKFGRDGEDLVLQVPCGTTIYRGEEVLVDL